MGSEMCIRDSSESIVAMSWSSINWLALSVSFKLALVSTILLLLISIPLAWWLATTRSRLRVPLMSIVAVPLVLPPTVIGFYLLLALAPGGFIGKLTNAIGLEQLAFRFPGLVLGSLVYSLPFVVQPIYQAFQSIDAKYLEVASTLRAGPVDRFFSIILPISKPGIIIAAVLGFAHTLGEFGVVLMIGGSIPGETKTASIQIYEYVELFEYGQAHSLSSVSYTHLTLPTIYSV